MEEDPSTETEQMMGEDGEEGWLATHGAASGELSERVYITGCVSFLRAVICSYACGKGQNLLPYTAFKYPWEHWSCEIQRPVG